MNISLFDSPQIRSDAWHKNSFASSCRAVRLDASQQDKVVRPKSHFKAINWKAICVKWGHFVPIIVRRPHFSSSPDGEEFSKQIINRVEWNFHFAHQGQSSFVVMNALRMTRRRKEKKYWELPEDLPMCSSAMQTVSLIENSPLRHLNSEMACYGCLLRKSERKTKSP